MRIALVRQLLYSTSVSRELIPDSVRDHLLPSTKLSALPAGVINGELVVDKAQFEGQLKLANSAYVAAAQGFHLYVGLNRVLQDKNGARYYWYLNFYDPKALDEPYWTATATKVQMHDFALKKSDGLAPIFSEIVHLTRPEDIRAPPIVFRDLLLDGIPEGRITLLGDAAHPMAPCEFTVLGSSIIERH